MLRKYLKGQESTKPMSSLRKHFWLSCLAVSIIFTASPVCAGLQGFNHFNPYTKKERILSLEEVPLKLQNYRAAMRDNLLMLIRYARQQNPEFKIIVHEGQDLLNKSLWEYSREGYNRARITPDADDEYFLFHNRYINTEPERDTAAYEYLHSIDAIAVNNLYCGSGLINPIAAKHHLAVISVEQCANQEALDNATVAALVDKRSIYGFTDLSSAFKTIGNYNLINDSSKNVYNFNDAQNILILNDDSNYKNQQDLIADLAKTNYDIIIIKPLFAYRQRFSADNLRKLHFKKNGSKRLLIAEFNVAEAHPKEYYWLNDWKIGSPDWLKRKSFSSHDGIIVKYWHTEWKKIISRYFKDLLNEGFDGVFFTGVENYRYFEQQNPLE